MAGFGGIVDRNLALFGKWLWRFPLEYHSLWAAVIGANSGMPLTTEKPSTFLLPGIVVLGKVFTKSYLFSFLVQSFP